MSAILSGVRPAGPAGITVTYPTRPCRGEKCEISIHVGVFFDGTGNNQDWVENPSVNWRKGLINWWSNKPRNTLTQIQQRSDSNVARLFRAYPDDPMEGYFRAYIPGVGTPFNDIGEHEPDGLGAAFGAGGDGRINFGMLHVLNAMYRSVSNNRPFIMPATVRALCSYGMAVTTRAGDSTLSKAAQDALRPAGMERKGGLLMDSAHNSHRTAFFKEQFARLAQRIASTPKPQLVEVFIDVFGFSRGAAQARAFCNWMEPLFQGDNLAGVRTHIRFLGIFDTVAAVGLGASATPFTDGHQSWGDAPYLRIPSRVRHCEHYVAMHENRGAFPLEDVRHGGILPARCRQYRYPGMHSDVGGGYSPTDQGRGPHGKDSEKLSQIPLNDMFAAAKAANVPLDRDMAIKASGWDCFEVAPSLREAFNAFFDANGRGDRFLKDCLMDYLSWRIRARDAYATLPVTLRASTDEREDLVGANRTLINDLATVQAWNTIDQRLADARKARTLLNQNSRQISALEEEKRNLASKMADLSSTASEVVARAQAWRAMSDAEQNMFANYCHDSYAGFKPYDAPIVGGIDAPQTWEPEGYLRYRTRYEGTDKRLTQLVPTVEARSETV
jgi:hypothetical protein